jgi:hypothetical protein
VSAHGSSSRAMSYQQSEGWPVLEEVSRCDEMRPRDPSFDNAESVHESIASEGRQSHASTTRNREQRVQRAMDVQDRKLAVKLKSTRKPESQFLTESAIANSDVVGGDANSKWWSFARPMEQAQLYWSLWAFSCLLGIVTAFFTPYRLSFDSGNPTLRRLDLSMDCYFMCFALLQALHVVPPHFSYLEISGTDLRWQIICAYFSRWCGVVELISALPFDFIASTELHADARLIFCPGLLRLGRIVRVIDFFAQVLPSLASCLLCSSV